MGPLAICAFLQCLPAFVASTRATLEHMGNSDSNASWWPL